MAMDWPMPEAAPVTRALRSVRAKESRMLMFSFTRRCRPHRGLGLSPLKNGKATRWVGGGAQGSGAEPPRARGLKMQFLLRGQAERAVPALFEC